MKENALTKKGTPRISKKGRKQIYIDDVGVTLSVQVPSKQKEIFKEIVLEMRKPYEINGSNIIMDINKIPIQLRTPKILMLLQKNGIKLFDETEPQ